MKIAIASGKGGTGKTTIAINLAYILAHMGKCVQYLDCDVEEPNGHIFLKPDIEVTEEVTVKVPRVDPDKCTLCHKCSQICQYKAIASLKEKVITFDQMCHSCGGCMLVCPSGAITEKPKCIGHLDMGKFNKNDFIQGMLEIGQIQTPALIKAVKAKRDPDAISIIDAPPGTSCPVIEAVKDSDHVLLVTEPTPFGMNDLILAVDMVRKLKLKHSVVINRSDIGDNNVRNYCRKEGIGVVVELPDDRKAAKAYSSGKILAETMPEWKKHFMHLAESLGI